MADLPRNETYSTGGAVASAPKASMAKVFNWKAPAQAAPAPAPTQNMPNVLGAYTPVSQEVKDFLKPGGVGFLPETPIGAPAEQKISPIPPGYSPFRVPGEFTNPASGVVPEQPAIHQFPQGGQMNVDLAHPGTLNKSVRANLNPLSTENTSILGTLSNKMFQVDHIIPLWAGGADTIANKQILPNPIHEAKTKIQAVAQTLLDHGEIDLNRARVMALNWQHRTASGIPDTNDYGEIPLDTAKAIAKEWEDFDAGKKGPSFGDVLKNIPEGAMNLGKGFLPEAARQFLVGIASGATAGGVPLESAPGATMPDKAAGLVGEVIGMFSGIGLFAKATRVAEVAMFGAKKGTESLVKMTAADTLGGSSVFDSIMAKAVTGAAGKTEAAKVSSSIAKRLKEAISHRTVLNTIRGNMTRDVIGNMARNATIFAEYGQFGQTISDFTQPQQDALNAHISRLGMDITLGGVVGAFPGTWAGAGKVGFGTMVLGLMAGENAQQALAQGVAMAGLHKIGGMAKDTTKAQKVNEYIVDQSTTKGSLSFLHTLVGERAGLSRVDPYAKAPKYDPALIGEWEALGRAEIQRLDDAGLLRPFAGAGSPPGDKTILETNLNAAIGWLKSRELPIEQQDRTYVEGLSSLARYAGEKREVAGTNAPKALPTFVKKLHETNPEILTERPAQTLEKDRWEISRGPEGRAPGVGDVDPALSGVRGEVRLTGQGADAVNEKQLQDFLGAQRAGNASPYVILANQPELGMFFREYNRAITPEMEKKGARLVDPENYISVWGIVKNAEGEMTIVPTGVKVPTKERIGVVTRTESGVRSVEGNEYAFNKDPDIVSGKYPEENPHFNNKTIATFMRSKGMPLSIARIKAFKGKDLREKNPYMVVEIGDREWMLARKMWETLGPPENLATYEENIARIVAEKGRTNVQPLLLKAADQLAERGHNASTVIKSETFTGVNEPRQNALFEMSDKTNKVLTTTRTPEEVRKRFDEDLGVQLTGEEAAAIDTARTKLTGGDVVSVVGKAVSEGRTTPYTAGNYVTYIKPLKTSKVFNSSGAGIMFEKMPILSKAEAHTERANRITNAASPAAPAVQAEPKSLLEQAPLTKAKPVEAAVSPEYEQALADLKMVGINSDRQYTKQGLDTYVDALNKKILEAKLTPEEKSKLGTEAIKLINREDLNARNVSWGSDEAWKAGTTPKEIDEFTQEMKQRIINATGAEEPVYAATRAKGTPEEWNAIVAKAGEGFLNSMKEGVATLPKDSRGYAFYKTVLGGLEKTLGPKFESDPLLIQVLSDKSWTGRRAFKKAFEEIDPRTEKPYSQPKTRVRKMAAGVHGKELYEESAQRGAELAGETKPAGTPESIGVAETGGMSKNMEESLPDWMRTQTESVPYEQGVRVASPTQAPSENVKDLTYLEAHTVPGLVADLKEPVMTKTGGLLPEVSEVEAGIEAGKMFLQKFIREEYNAAGGKMRAIFDNPDPKYGKQLEWNDIISPIKKEAEVSSKSSEAVAKAQTKIEELKKQDETLANVGGSKAVAYAKKVAEANKKTIAELEALVKKYSSPAPDGGGGPGFDVNSPGKRFANLSETSPMSPASFKLPGSAPSQNWGKYFSGTVIAERPQLNPVDVAPAIHTIGEANKALTAPPPEIRMGPTVFSSGLDLQPKAPGVKREPSFFEKLKENITNMMPSNKSTYERPKDAPNNNPIIMGYDTSAYAEDPVHAQRIRAILANIPQIASAADASAYILKIAQKSPITGEMVWNSAQKWGVPPGLLIATMQQDSSLGTAGAGAKTKNPGNVGTYTDKKGRNLVGVYKTWQAGVDAVAQWLAEHKTGVTALNKPPKSQYVNQVVVR